MKDKLLGFNTRSIRAGQKRTAEGEHSDPIFMTSSFVFDNAEQAAKRFADQEKGNVYSRYTNPTVNSLEKRIASLEEAEAAVATATGMSAILSIAMALLKTGDHIVCAAGVFGATITLFNRYMDKFGVTIDYVSSDDAAAWQAAIKPETRLLFLESPSNPLMTVYDIAALGKLAEDNNAFLVVDNCFCTPALQRPLTLGAHIVVHSATKYLDGQGRCMGGLVLGAKEQMDAVRSFLRTAGPTLSPFNAWLIYTGLETLNLRMQHHCANAMQLAEFLAKNAAVEKVYYAGLTDHAGHSLAKQQQSGFGGVLSFEVRGGRDGAWRIIDAARLCSLTANLGDTKTTIIHPATTTHGRLSDAERDRIGIGDNLIRIAVGLEDIEDIKADLESALQQC